MRHIILTVLLLRATSLLWGQTTGISINTSGSDPDASAMLDVQSTQKGILIPRMSSAQRIAIPAPAQGLLVFDNQTHSFWVYNGTSWQQLIQGNETFGTIQSHNPADTLTIRAADEGAVPGIIRGQYSVDLQASRIAANQVASGSHATISGGANNIASKYAATVSGGETNVASADFSFVGGGVSNIASGTWSFAGGGRENVASGSEAFVGGGRENIASGSEAFVGGGYRDTASGDEAFVGGGWENIASALGAFVGGGGYNTASGTHAFVGGGQDNTASGVQASVGGGVNNTASGVRAFVGGGANHTASGSYSTIPGGHFLSAPSYGETVIGLFNETYVPISPLVFNANDRLFVVGNGTSPSNRSNALTVLKNGHIGIGTTNPNTALHIIGQIKYEDGNQQSGYVLTSDTDGIASWQKSNSGTVQSHDSVSIRAADEGAVPGNIRGQYSVDLQASRTADSLVASGQFATISGGANNMASGASASVGGGKSNISSGAQSTIGGGLFNNTEGTQSTIGGGHLNKAEGVQSTIGGGFFNWIEGNKSTVAGGQFNFAKGDDSAIGGGNDNTALGIQSTIGGGHLNLASGFRSTVSGGTANTASGAYASISGGFYLQAPSYGETVIGVYNKLYTPIDSLAFNANDRLFVVGNGTDVSNRSNALTILKNGNVGIGTATPTKAKLEIDGFASYDPAVIGYLNLNGQVGSYNPAVYQYSLYASHTISGQEFHAHSDQRIKEIQGVSDRESDLKTLMQIEVTDYHLRDSISKGNRPVKKVIAQQVAEVYPQAVRNNLTEVVPDIYQRAEMQDGWIMLATDLQAGERVKMITKQSSKVYEVINVQSNRFQVKGMSIPSTDTGIEIFVYGREVDDFHTVDYEAISMLNVSATQQQQRIIEMQQAEIKIQKAELKELKTQQQQTTLELNEIKAMLKGQKAHDPNQSK